MGAPGGEGWREEEKGRGAESTWKHVQPALGCCLGLGIPGTGCSGQWSRREACAQRNSTGSEASFQMTQLAGAEASGRERVVGRRRKKDQSASRPSGLHAIPGDLGPMRSAPAFSLSSLELAQLRPCCQAPLQSSPHTTSPEPIH